LIKQTILLGTGFEKSSEIRELDLANVVEMQSYHSDLNASGLILLLIWGFAGRVRGLAGLW
jgi:hypothetical protein